MQPYKDLLQFRNSASDHLVHQEDLWGSLSMLLLLNSRPVAVAVAVVVGAEVVGLEAEHSQVAYWVRAMDLLVGTAGSGFESVGVVEVVEVVDLIWQAKQLQDLVEVGRDPGDQ